MKLLQCLPIATFILFRAKIENGKVLDLYPSIPTQFINSFSLAGTMTGKLATLKLNFGFGTLVTYSKTITINADNLTDPSMLGRLWAEKKIEELSFNEEKNKEQISFIGKEYGIVTANTSLIVS